MNRYELARAQRLLRRVDLEEVLGEVGLDIVFRHGADVYTTCPDPSHVDDNPSFHVCVEDVVDRDGECRLGWFRCWSHPGGWLQGKNFFDLLARIRSNSWEESEWPGPAGREQAVVWFRNTFVREVAGVDPGIAALAKRAKLRIEPVRRDLIWPPSMPIETARAEFQEYIRSRGMELSRASEIGVRAVYATGNELYGSLGQTVPGVLIPITGECGQVINWYVRSIFRVRSRIKGRYCPGIPFVKEGVFYRTGDLNYARPAALVEGIFDAERVRRLIELDPGRSCVPASNVVAVLGGRLYPEQARRLRRFPTLIHIADGDAGGKLLYDTVEEHLSPFTKIEYRPMPPAMDPADAPVNSVYLALRPVIEAKLVSIRFRRAVRAQRG